MKLLAKTNRFYLIFLLFLAPIMIAIDYGLIRYFVYTEVNEILEHESERIKYHVETRGELPHSRYVYEATPVGAAFELTNPFRDTLIYDAYVDKTIPYRKYDFLVDVGHQKAKVSLRHILIEARDLIVWLSAGTAIVFLLMVIGLFFINQKISKWAWKPFYRNLSKLERYNITHKNPPQLEDSGISEFKALNRVIAALMAQVEKDFQNLKEFNENISHEMQTPLAIIRNKMVLLLESQSLSDKDLQWVRSAYQEVNKLSKIGKSLTLISRIENQEFTRLESVDLRAIVGNIINSMEEIIEFKHIEMRVELNTVKVQCDPTLADILFTNLIKNAIQHNQEGGYIRMSLNEEKFEIENPGEILDADTSQLFKRFQRGSTTGDNLGLGLAIAQRICERYGFQLDYQHQNGNHHFTLCLSP